MMRYCRPTVQISQIFYQLFDTTLQDELVEVAKYISSAQNRIEHLPEASQALNSPSRKEYK